jgi:hypothetical protein
MEIWKDVPGYEGWYQVSDAGRVRSLARKVSVPKNRWGGASVRRINEAVMSLQYDRRRRVFVALRKNGIAKRFTVASLVAAAFIGPRPEGLLVLHGDGNSENNRADNLRYGTHTDNIEDARLHGTLSQGETQWLAKLTASEVMFIRITEMTGAELAKHYGVTPACISAIRQRKNWKHV